MKSNPILPALVVTAAAAAGAASAASLAGSEGQVRSRPHFEMGGTGGCQGMWKQYVGAAGHSAYATTPFNRMVEGVICATTLNAGSKSAAEAAALAECTRGLKRYKMAVVRSCAIGASK